MSSRTLLVPHGTDLRSQWSGDLVEALKALWQDRDLSAAAIARRLGVSRNAVLGKVHRLGLSNRRSPLVARAPRIPAAARPIGVRRPMVRSAARPQPQPAEPPLAEPLLSPAFGLVAHLEDLPLRACHWPFGDPAGAGFRFCGRPAGERIYCPGHWALGHRSGGTPALAGLLRGVRLRA